MGIRFGFAARKKGGNGETYPIKEVKDFKVDGEVVKPDTYYKLVDGKAVEIK